MMSPSVDSRLAIYTGQPEHQAEQPEHVQQLHQPYAPQQPAQTYNPSLQRAPNPTNRFLPPGQDSPVIFQPQTPHTPQYAQAWNATFGDISQVDKDYIFNGLTRLYMKKASALL